MKKSKSDVSVIESILAACVHENKNRIGKLSHYMDQLTETISLSLEQKDYLSRIQDEMARISASLTDMLLQYKYFDYQGHAIEVSYHELVDFFEELIARHTLTQEVYHVTIQLDYDQALGGFFNEFILAHLIDTCIHNSVQAGATKLLMRAEQQDGFLCLSLHDNGAGFDEHFIENFKIFSEASVEPKESEESDETSSWQQEGAMSVKKTGLGLRLLKTLTEAHQNQQRKGSMTLGRSADLGGAQVNLFLP
jgi:light-regulated signal transduction histidine kinase (bacteriophytochrome)